jgi:hypothetical protein
LAGENQLFGRKYQAGVPTASYIIDMKSKFLMCVLCALAALLPVPSASAEPNKEQYELQERCGKRAEQFFKQHDYSNARYENHYNPDLNGCFLLVNTILRQPGKGVTWIEWELWDVNENRLLDDFILQPSPEDLRIASQPRSPSAPEPRVSACLAGNFTICDQGFGEVVRRYMER